MRPRNLLSRFGVGESAGSVRLQALGSTRHPTLYVALCPMNAVPETVQFRPILVCLDCHAELLL